MYLSYVGITIAAEDDDLGQPGKRVRPGISASIITELTDCNATLSQQRKKRQVLIHVNVGLLNFCW
jgi:hypothetical protein